MSKSQRTKGATAEREVAAILSDALGVNVQRQLGQARDGGDDIRLPPFRIEVKRRETLAMDAWSRQVEACAGPDDIPVVVYRRSREPWRVSLLFSDFLAMMSNELEADNGTNG